MTRRLICFDLDGTLIPYTTSSGHLATTLGHAADLVVYENNYAAGKINNREVVDFDAKWYKGIALDEISDRLESIQVLHGIAEVVSEVHDRGYHAVIGTVGWRFVAEWFCRRFGFDDYCGPDLERDETGHFTGLVSRHFDELDKLSFVRTQAERLGILLEQCVAVGDGRSDIPVFEIVGTSIAVNGTSAANAAARFQVSTRDLRDILPFVPA